MDQYLGVHWMRLFMEQTRYYMHSAEPNLQFQQQLWIFWKMGKLMMLGYEPSWRFQDTIIWNFCPVFFRLPSIEDQIKSTLKDPSKNIHFMENYLDTREQWLFPGFLSIRSIGIKKCNVGISNFLSGSDRCSSQNYLGRTYPEPVLLPATSSTWGPWWDL